MIAVTAKYFAAFRERAGVGSERVATQAQTTGDLYAELARQHGFADEPMRCKVALNDELVDWSAPLAEGDVVLFFPPVAGG